MKTNKYRLRAVLLVSIVVAMLSGLGITHADSPKMKPAGVTAVSDAATISTDANVDTITAATKQFSARIEFCSS